MATPAKPTVNPIALKKGEGEALWFFGSLANVKASSETIGGGSSAQPCGDRACRVREFKRVLGEPAAAHTIPPTSVPFPSREKIMAAAAELGIEILGPPGIPT